MGTCKKFLDELQPEKFLGEALGSRVYRLGFRVRDSGVGYLGFGKKKARLLTRWTNTSLDSEDSFCCAPGYAKHECRRLFLRFCVHSFTRLCLNMVA